MTSVRSQKIYNPATKAKPLPPTNATVDTFGQPTAITEMVHTPVMGAPSPPIRGSKGPRRFGGKVGGSGNAKRPPPSQPEVFRLTSGDVWMYSRNKEMACLYTPKEFQRRYPSIYGSGEPIRGAGPIPRGCAKNRPKTTDPEPTLPEAADPADLEPPGAPRTHQLVDMWPGSGGASATYTSSKLRPPTYEFGPPNPVPHFQGGLMPLGYNGMGTLGGPREAKPGSNPGPSRIPEPGHE